MKVSPCVFVSPTEPAPILALGRTSSIPERYGSDLLFAAHGALVGLQRKAFPSDFMASLHDGRLSKEVHQMQALPFSLLLLEGRPRFTSDGHLIYGSGHGYAFTRDALRGLTLSLQFEFGIPALWTEGLADTAALVPRVVDWFRKAGHDSLRRRPKKSDLWRDPCSRARRLDFLQGLPGIGLGLAEEMLDYFGGMPLTWTVGKKGLLGCPGIGPKRCKDLLAFIPEPIPEPRTQVGGDCS